MANSRYLLPGPHAFTAAAQTLTDPERGRRYHHQICIAWVGAGADNRMAVARRQYAGGPLVAIAGSPFAPAGGDTIQEFTGHYYDIVFTSSTLGVWAGTVNVHYLDFNEGDSDPIPQGTLTDISET